MTQIVTGFRSVPSRRTDAISSSSAPAILSSSSLVHVLISAAGHLFEPFRIPIALHRDLRDGAPDLTQILRSQFDGSRSDILFQAVQLRGARDRHDPRLLSKQPADRYLSGRRLLPSRDFAEQINQGLVRPSSLRREAGNDVAEVAAVERRGLADRAREEALAERAERHEADPEFLERRQYLLFGASPPQRVFALDS